MTPFSTLTSVAAPLLRDNVDTDAIIPSREMRFTGKTGLASGLFAAWRYSEDRVPDPGFVLNQPDYARAAILLAGKNFGCGSSREHAVWALLEYGIRCVIAESFAPIFRNNAVRNGLLPVVLDATTIRGMSGRAITIDLAAQRADGYPFEIDAEAKTMLLEGLDAIDLTLKHRDAITAWTALDRVARPWVYLGPPHAERGEGDHFAQRNGGGVRGYLRKSNAAVLRARKLRREMSPDERRLWASLRERPGGLKFRKQHPADDYTLDFYCAAAKLCIEVDGEAHSFANRPQRDEARDAFLTRHGVATLRIPAREVRDDIDAVLRYIEGEAAARIPLHHSAGRNGPPPQTSFGEENQ